MILGRATSAALKTDGLPLQVLDHTINQAKENLSCLDHYGDHGNQYISIADGATLGVHGTRCSTCGMGDSSDNSLPGTVNGLYKSGFIYSRRYEDLTEVEFTTH